MKPRIRERLGNSKNMVLFLSSITTNSRALREEVDYGINSMGLPVIVVYPDFSEKSEIISCESKRFRKQIKDLWDKLPKFRDSMENVPTLHVPMMRQCGELVPSPGGSCTSSSERTRPKPESRP